MVQFIYFAPDGKPCFQVLTRSWASPDVTIDAFGGIAETSYGEGLYPDPWTAGGEVTLIADGTEWLQRHCRMVEVRDTDFYVWEFSDGVDGGPEPWPSEIIAKCTEARQLEHGLEILREARYQFDSGFFDAVVAPVWDAIVIGKAKTRLEALDAEITTFRQDRTEVTVIEEPVDAEA